MNAEVWLGMAFTLGWAPLFVYRTEALGDALRVYGRAEKFWVVAAPVILSLHVGASSVLLASWGSPSAHHLLLSTALFVAGICFWFWARRTICPLNTRRPADQPPITLRRDGPFGLVRNPLYFGTLLAAAAPALAAGRPELLVTFAGSVLALVVRSLQDERRLLDQLGAEYEDYSRTVKRLVPYVW